MAINALEVHRSHAEVQAEVANMLAALAEHDGEARSISEWQVITSSE